MNDSNSIIMFWKSKLRNLFLGFLPYQEDVFKIEVETTFSNFQAYWMNRIKKFMLRLENEELEQSSTKELVYGGK